MKTERFLLTGALVAALALTAAAAPPRPEEIARIQRQVASPSWVGVPPSNVVVRKPEEDGSISDKFGWWRGVSGELRVEGGKLDGPALPLRASIPDGYGDPGFQSSALIFPADGCWEVTERVGDSLAFGTLVLRVRPASRWGAPPAAPSGAVTP